MSNRAASIQPINLLPTNPDNVWIRGAWLVATTLIWLLVILSIPGYIEGFDLLLKFTARNDALILADIVGRLMAATAGAVSLFLAYLLYHHRHEHPIGIYLAFFFLLYGVLGGGTGEAAWAYWAGNPDDMPIDFPEAIVSAPLAFTLLVFPNGKLNPRWTRWIVFGYIFGSIVGFWHPAPGTPEWLIKSRQAVEVFWFVVLPIFVIYALVIRYRRVYTTQEQEQTKWLFFGLLLLVFLYTISAILWRERLKLSRDADVPWWVIFNSLAFWGAALPLPVTLTISILYYRLWDINVVVNRTLVYSGLTGAVIVIYIVIVGSIGALFQTSSNLAISLFATGVVATSFQGLRDRIQRTVNRLMYGERDEPYTILTRLGNQLKNTLTPQELLATITATIAAALKLPYVAIAIRQDNENTVRAAFGIDHTPSERFPLIYQNELVGELIVGQRSSIDTFTPADYQVLENIAQQTGAVVHAVRLSIELQHSRERLVTAIEEERRRIRRDLHDGIGPALASQTLRLDAAADLIREQPDKAVQLILDLKSQTKTLVTDIRRLVYDLRPPALDDLGLTESLRSHVQQLTPQQTGLAILLDIPDQLPALSAAVEVAIYRITQEALTNVIKHAKARHCEVRLFPENNYLHLEIEDDGKGLPLPLKTGVGLQSMRERAEELGGHFDADITDNGGTIIKISFGLNGATT